MWTLLLRFKICKAPIIKCVENNKQIVDNWGALSNAAHWNSYRSLEGVKDVIKNYLSFPQTQASAQFEKVVWVILDRIWKVKNEFEAKGGVLNLNLPIQP